MRGNVFEVFLQSLSEVSVTLREVPDNDLQQILHIGVAQPCDPLNQAFDPRAIARAIRPDNDA
jgi:hypothetical protein